MLHQALIDTIKTLYPQQNPVPLHAPVFDGREKEYLADCIDTTFVSSVGAYVDGFEAHMRRITGASHAIAVVNGTCALHMALLGVGVHTNDLVITQSLTFVATCNAIAHAGASPVFVDVDAQTMGMCPKSLQLFLEQHTQTRNGTCVFTATGQVIRACLPMHTYGHPCAIQAIITLCNAAGIAVVEDAAEALGSFIGTQHVGGFGRAGVFSFNGNKTVTAGGGVPSSPTMPPLANA